MYNKYNNNLYAYHCHANAYRNGTGLVGNPKFKHSNYDRFSLGQTKSTGIAAVTAPRKFQP